MLVPMCCLPWHVEHIKEAVAALGGFLCVCFVQCFESLSGDASVRMLPSCGGSLLLERCKRLYSESRQQQLRTNESASLWTGFRQIPNYKAQAYQAANDLLRAIDLGEFYCCPTVLSLRFLANRTSIGSITSAEH